MEIVKLKNVSTEADVGNVRHKPTGAAPVIRGNLTPNQAFDAMVAGKIVQRFHANILGKFHCMRSDLFSNAGDAGELQIHTANTAQDAVDGKWYAIQTDVATWYSSTFNVVIIRAPAIQIIYEDYSLQSNLQ